MKFVKVFGTLIVFMLIASDIIALKSEIRRSRHTGRLSSRSFKSKTKTPNFDSIYFLLGVFERADIFTDVIRVIKTVREIVEVDVLGEHLKCTIKGLSDYYKSQLTVRFPEQTSVTFDSKTYCEKYFDVSLEEQKIQAQEKLDFYGKFKKEIDMIPEADLVNNPEKINQFPKFKYNFEHTKKIHERKQKNFEIRDAIIKFMDLTEKKINYYNAEFTQAVLQKE
jgi:hypothetical protein